MLTPSALTTRRVSASSEQVRSSSAEGVRCLVLRIVVLKARRRAATIVQGVMGPNARELSLGLMWALMDVRMHGDWFSFGRMIRVAHDRRCELGRSGL